MLFKGLKSICAGAVALNLVLSLAVWAGSNEVALLVRQTPDKAGSVSPASGVHHFQTDSTIVVTAQPVQGYEFAYWLGDVVNPAAVTTQVLLNKPKIVVAVFNPTDPDQVIRSFGPGAGAGSYGDGEMQYLGDGGPVQTIASARDYVRNGFSGSGVGTEGGGGGGTNVPEPLTAVLLSAGMAMLAIRRRMA